MSDTPLTDKTADLATMAERLKDQAERLAMEAGEVMSRAAEGGGDAYFMHGLTVFVLACFIGYYVVWRVTPALHSPLMGVTNAISSVIIVGAIIAAGPTMEGDAFSQLLGFLAVTLASINIVGGFIVTRRMLSMFKKKEAK